MISQMKDNNMQVSDSNVPEIIFTDQARIYIKRGVAILERAEMQSESMIVIISFPMSRQLAGNPDTRRSESLKGGHLVSLGLIEQVKITDELKMQLDGREIAIRLTGDLSKRATLLIDFDQELFVGTSENTE